MKSQRKITRFISGLILATTIELLSVATLLLEPTALASPPESAPSWSFTGSLNAHRNNHTATLLPNGKVLVAGGNSGAGIQGILNSAELYDPATGTWSLTASLNVPRSFSTATLLPNGKVLVAGGTSSPSSVTATAELYDPATGTWSLTGNLNTTRFWHSATLLQNGKVLIAGGHGGQDGPRHSAELYDPASGTWSVTGRLLNTGGAGRIMHTATLLQNGKVLVVGGIDGDDFEVSFSSAELYNPDTGTWSVAGSLSTTRALHTATLLQNGKVLVVGGSTASDSAELYDPATDTWSHAGTLSRRSSHTATLLPNGQVLIAGGANSGNGVGGLTSLNSAELYDPSTGTWSNTAHLNTARYGHTATLLQNGKVLVAGGFDNTLSGTLNSAELYDPAITSTANPIDDPQFFVRQHYLDFLSREPEAGQPWSAILNSCPNPFNLDPNSPSADCDRILVSSSFFLSPEFRLKGSYVFTFYRVAFDRLADFAEIIADMQSVTGQTPADTFARRAAFPISFAGRQEFRARFDSLSDAAFVAALLDRYGLTAITTPDPQQPEGGQKVVLTRADLTSRLDGGALTRAVVLRAVVESDEVSAAEFNRAFVAMQYYGYLRRTPEEAGYNDWLNHLTAHPTDFRTMVHGFVNSVEYRMRFGQP